MLVALVTLLFLGGGGGMDLFPKDVQKNVAVVVEDQATAEAVVAQMRYVERVGSELSAKTAKAFKTWRKRDLDHDAGPELFRQAVDEADAERLRNTDRFLDALLRDETQEDEDWIVRLRSLPDAPETYYLLELLASNDFQTGLENYLDLLDLRRRLADWSARVAPHDASHEEALGRLSDKIEETTARVEDLMTRQGQLLEKLATDELTARLRRLDSYANKARFGLADSKDRVSREEQE